MKVLLIIIFMLFCPSPSSNLFDGVTFNKQGIGYKTNIPVTYRGIGRADTDKNIQRWKKDYKSTTALEFFYKDKKYYIPIEEKNMPDFIFKLKEGDLLFIDIVVFDTKICQPGGRQPDKYCSYINKIRRKCEKVN
jgi:hypothetical protein